MVDGTQMLLDLYGVTPVGDATAVLERAVESAGLTVVARAQHDFGGGEVTALLVLSQSHAALHTWYTHGFVSVDVFTCGDPEVNTRRLRVLRDILVQEFKATDSDTTIMRRALRHA